MGFHLKSKMQSVSATPGAEIRSLGAKRERSRASGIPRTLSLLHRAAETLRLRQHHLIISRPSQHFSAEVSSTSTEVHLMVHSRFGEICSCCCLPALPCPSFLAIFWAPFFAPLYTEVKKMACTWFGEICYCCS